VGLLDVTEGPLCITKLIEIFSKNLPAVSENGCYNLEFEV
jgi:hypothetical protein